MARLLVKDAAGTIYRVLAEHREYWFLVERRQLADGETPPAPIVGLKSDYVEHVLRLQIEDRVVSNETGEFFTIRGVYDDADSRWVRLQDSQGVMHFERLSEAATRYQRV